MDTIKYKTKSTRTAIWITDIVFCRTLRALPSKTSTTWFKDRVPESRMSWVISPCKAPDRASELYSKGVKERRAVITTNFSSLPQSAVAVAFAVPLPFVDLCLKRIVAKVDSMGFVVRI